MDEEKTLDALDRMSRGADLESRGRTDEAAAEYRAALKLDAANVEGWVALGNLAYSAGEAAEARAAYRKALALSPGQPEASNNLAMMLLASGKDLARAEELARDALEQETPLRPFILDTLARVQMRQGKYADAWAAVEEAQELAPEDAEGLLKALAETRRAIEALPVVAAV